LNLLLDTHTVLWWFAGDSRMPSRVRSAIADASSVWVSAVSAYEIRLKHRLGKLPQAGALVADFQGWMTRSEFKTLSVEFDHAFAAAGYEQAHRDPFDRMLIAQALREDLVLVSRDSALEAFGVQRIW
jgi:PIN domain nuclease of toxin-antitoxin system